MTPHPTGHFLSLVILQAQLRVVSSQHAQAKVDGSSMSHRKENATGMLPLGGKTAVESVPPVYRSGCFYLSLINPKYFPGQLLSGRKFCLACPIFPMCLPVFKLAMGVSCQNRSPITDSTCYHFLFPGSPFVRAS